MEEPGIGGRDEKQNKRRGGGGHVCSLRVNSAIFQSYGQDLGDCLRITMKLRLSCTVHEMHWKL